MISARRQLLIVVLIAFVAAIAGVLLGRLLIPVRQTPGSDLHRLLHHDLDLDAPQTAKLDMLERNFIARRLALERALRADNARLAVAIEAEHGYGPEVAAAVDRSHSDIGELQKVTLAHIFAMRALLRPDQAHHFDAAVTRTLTADAE